MSAVGKTGASWLAQNYDKLLLVVVILGLLISSLILLLKMSRSEARLANDPTSQPDWQGRPAVPVDVGGLTGLVDQIVHPLQMGAAQRRMMVGEVRVASIPDGAPIPFNATRDPFSNAEQPSIDFNPDSDGDGLTDKQELANGLNPNDPSDAGADADGDGYTNAEEIQMGTDLKDATKYPPPVAKLRLIRTVVNPFKFRFLGISRLPDGDRYQLNLRSLERTYFARMGDELDGFKITNYEPQTPEGPVLTLIQGETTIRLIQGRVINQEARTADLVLLLDRRRYRCQVGTELKLKDLTYKVVDIKADRVVLRESVEGKETVVTSLTSDERARLLNDLSGAGGAASPTSPAATGATGATP